MPEASHTPDDDDAQACDVLIVGAGLSGIGAACHLQRRCPTLRYRILEGRAASGGTWDLFRYPGIRSDSDMHTLGYGFKPWLQAQAIADGPAILRYIRETAAEHGVERHILYQHRVTAADWSAAAARWTVQARRADGSSVQFSARVMHLCSGYYDYDAGHLPDWPGVARFRGRTVHPQHWPEGLDLRGQRVVVIGSGATAVTLVPELAKTAQRVTMLQRSPTYIVSRPSVDAIANRLRRHLPAGLAYGLTRWKNVLRGWYYYSLAKRQPARVKAAIVALVKKDVGPGIDVQRHFTPRYAPWDQRVCLVPDGDLFNAVREGRVDVVTDEIETFTETGLLLRSGAALAADTIVTATGLRWQQLGGVRLSIDGQSVDLRQSLTYKGMMYSDVPNLSYAFGYTNASWTLRADLVAEYLCRLLNHLQRSGHDHYTPRCNDPTVTEDPTLPLNAGYMQRARALLPRQGSKAPWKAHQNYLRDLLLLRWHRLDDGSLVFGRKGAAAPRARAPLVHPGRHDA